MANQWGRESGGFSAGGRSRAPLILAVLFALGLGIAGGYGAARMLLPDNSAAIDDAERRAADLQSENDLLADELAAMQAELDAAKAAAEGGQDADTAALRATIARQAKELDELTEQLAAASAREQEGASAADRQGADLKALRQERDGLAAENRRLGDAIASLEAERDALKDGAASGQAALSAEIARLRDEIVPGLTAERDRLSAEVTQLMDRATSLDGQVSALAQAKAKGDARIAELEGQLADARAQLAEAEQALAEATAEAASGTAEQPAEPGGTGLQPTPDAGGKLTPRDEGAVEAALRAAPGLGTLSAVDRQELKDMLVAGECVTTSLRAVFDHIPILALRSLILGLHSGC